MKLNRLELGGMVAALTLIVLASVFVEIGVARADVSGAAINGTVMTGLCQFGMIWAACEHNAAPIVTPNGTVGNENSAQQINCQIYTQLIASGSPIPPSFDASQCGSGTTGGGSGGSGSGSTDACPNEATDPGPQAAGPCNADDVCPNIAGIQTATTECPTGGGGESGNNGGGGGFSGGGGGGGGGGYLQLATSSATTSAEVLGTATSTPQSCDMYLTAFLRFGKSDNDTEQVKRLQHVLNKDGSMLEESGIFDEATLTAVHNFQTKYKSEILTPWKITNSTGFVYLTTRKKVNEIYCDHDVVFPLSSEETAVIEKVKEFSKKESPKKELPQAMRMPAAASAATIEIDDSSATSTPKLPVTKPWGSMGDFFRRVFNRGR